MGAGCRLGGGQDRPALRCSVATQVEAVRQARLEAQQCRFQMERARNELHAREGELAQLRAQLEGALAAAQAQAAAGTAAAQVRRSRRRELN